MSFSNQTASDEKWFSRLPGFLHLDCVLVLRKGCPNGCAELCRTFCIKVEGVLPALGGFYFPPREFQIRLGSSVFSYEIKKCFAFTPRRGFREPESCAYGTALILMLVVPLLYLCLWYRSYTYACGTALILMFMVPLLILMTGSFYTSQGIPGTGLIGCPIGKPLVSTKKGCGAVLIPSPHFISAFSGKPTIQLSRVRDSPRQILSWQLPLPA